MYGGATPKPVKLLSDDPYIARLYRTDCSVSWVFWVQFLALHIKWSYLPWTLLDIVWESLQEVEKARLQEERHDYSIYQQTRSCQVSRIKNLESEPNLSPKFRAFSFCSAMGLFTNATLCDTTHAKKSQGDCWWYGGTLLVSQKGISSPKRLPPKIMACTTNNCHGLSWHWNHGAKHMWTGCHVNRPSST